jgi:ammonia channel protein AmtB
MMMMKMKMMVMMMMMMSTLNVRSINYVALGYPSGYSKENGNVGRAVGHWEKSRQGNESAKARKKGMISAT